jgi:hypothetical protein
MPAVFAKLGIRFLYPDNWELDEKEALAGNPSVTVYSPGGAFWSIDVHPADVNRQELTEAALAAMRQEYDELDAEAVREEAAGRELVGYDLNFYCLDLTNSALIRAVRAGPATYLILCQAEDREFAQLEPVFRAITASVLAPKP